MMPSQNLRKVTYRTGREKKPRQCTGEENGRRSKREKLGDIKERETGSGREGGWRNESMDESKIG